MTKHRLQAQQPAAIVVLGWTFALALALAGCGPRSGYSRFLPQGDVDGGAADVELLPAVDAETAGTGGGAGRAGAGGNVVNAGGAVGTAGASAGGRGGMGTGGRGGGAGGATSGGAGGLGGGGAGGAASPGGGGGATATGGAGTGTGGSAGPRIISLDFSGSETVMTASEVAGFKPASHWNSAPSASGTLSSVMDQAGVATGASATWSAGNGGVYRLSWTDAPGDARMMNGYLDPYNPNSPASVTVTNLPAALGAARYDVYLYAYGPLAGGTRSSKYTLGTTNITIWQTGPSAGAFGGFSSAADGGSGNMIVFRGVTGTSFTVAATPDSATGTATRAPVNGLQIVSPSGS